MKIFIVLAVCLFGCLYAADDAVSPPPTFNSPGHVRVLPTVIAENPGGYTLTSGGIGDSNRLMGINFEPFQFRTKTNAIGDAANELLLPSNTYDQYNTVSSGFWDGAQVRVYRIVDKVLTKVRTDTVKEHITERWYAVDVGGQLISPMENKCRFSLLGYNRIGVDYYYGVFAVDKFGNESPASNVVKVFIPTEYSKIKEKPNNETIAFKAKKSKEEMPEPPSPQGLVATLDAKTGFVNLTWKGVDASDLAGYRIKYSAVDPAKMRGDHIYLNSIVSDPSQYIKTGDMIFLDKSRRDWDPEVMFSYRVFNLKTNYPRLYFVEDDKRHWRLVDYPEPAPQELKNSGTTCVQIDIDGEEDVSFFNYCYADTQQDYYRVLDPQKTYVVEVWARQEGMKDPRLTFSMPGPYWGKIPPVELTMTSDWTLHRFDFKVPYLLDKKTYVGGFKLAMKGPGRVWLDNWRIYEKSLPYMAYPDSEVEILKKSGMSAYRTHSLIKTTWGYSMAGLTNTVDGLDWRGTRPNSTHTLPSLLELIQKIGIDPWLQIEMCMNEDEWLGFIEYFCAPYDPKVDTPESKPWACKRYRQGHKEPYLTDFNRILFEISNETWNNMFVPFIFSYPQMTDEKTGETYSGGAIYGLFQEYVINQFRSSPYWTKEAESKFEFVLGGWSAAMNKGGYTAEAALHSPSSKHITIAAYNGGWDEKAPPAKAAPKGYFDALSIGQRSSLTRTLKFKEVLDEFNLKCAMGTYEAGPGYNLNGLNGVSMSKDQVEQESRTMKSLAAGTATLDVFLTQGSLGYKIQNFFTFNRRRNYWSSHARLRNGGQAYPPWKLLSLYNREGTGDFLLSQTLRSPTWTFEKKGKKAATNDMPLIGVYATRKNDRLNVFVLSRKVVDYPFVGDLGYSPLTLDLPIRSAKGLKLFRMTGDPGAHNLDSDLVKIEELDLPASLAKQEFIINNESGADDQGLPPASTFLYVFSDVDWKTSPASAALSPAPGQATPAMGGPVRFRLALPDSATAPNISDFSSTGSAQELKILAVEPVPASNGSCFDIVVGGALVDGDTVVLEYAGQRASINIFFPAGVDTCLAALDFPDGSDAMHEGKTIPFSSHASVILNPVLHDSTLMKFHNNIPYNNDGVGRPRLVWSTINPEAYYSFIVQPVKGKTIALKRLKMGVYGDPQPKIELHYSMDGFVSSKALTLVLGDKVSSYKGDFRQDVGFPVTADLNGEGDLQAVQKAVEFRMYIFGCEAKTVAGLGKLGKDVEDIVVEGMLLK